MTKTLKNKFLVAVAGVALGVAAVAGGAVKEVAPAKAEGEEFSPSGSICVMDGASVRVDSMETSGIRFMSFVKATDFPEGATAGSVIIPETYVTQVKAANNDVFNFVNLLTWVEAQSAPLAVATVEEPVDDGSFTGYLAYAATMNTIQEHNYTTKFTCISYMYTATETAGFEAVTGNSKLADGYYMASEYNENSVRSVYQVAHAALTSNDAYAEKSKEIMKSYADGVVYLSDNGGTADITVANTVAEKYTSPYTVAKATTSKSKTSYTVDVTKATPKVVLLNDERIELPYVNGNVRIDKTVSSGATVNADGSLELAGKTVVNGNTGTLCLVDNSYMALSGTYAAGTYLEFEFTGNNMPQLCFFADEINGKMTYANEWTEKTVVNDGLIVLNGIKTDGVNGFTNYVGAWGLHRYDYNNNASKLGMSSTQSSGKGFSQDELSATSDKTYRMVIGTYLNAAKSRVYLNMYLFDKDKNTLVGSIDISTGTPVWDGTTATEQPTGHIIAMAGLKGGDNTTFTFKGIGAKADFDTTGA